MISPLDTTNPNCRMGDNTLCGTQGQDNCDLSRCPTRLSTVKTQLETFLSSHATQARYGLAFFPATESGSSTAAESCRSFSQLTVPPPTVDEATRLQLSADAVLQAIRNVPTPAGSTPLGDTLEMLVQQTPLGTSAASAGDAVVIISDGLPNCNANNPNDGSQPALCRCTALSCMGALARLGCLDLDAPSALMSNLRARGVRTYVMPLGNEVAMGEGPQVFQSLAEAGGTLRPCPNGTNAECGASYVCNPSTRLCSGPSLLPGELDRVLAP
ncbi:vWA domain-containing protein [Hyalangium gracile]|uniref:vWA domain-containing protein n=1 Tax=Hyalangium gracile TaxID=394092 RepID=UPI001CCC88EE|nr:vWA domain-containing protein [Hyalangium gracile]